MINRAKTRIKKEKAIKKNCFVYFCYYFFIMRAKMSEKTQYEAACNHTNILEPNSLSC